MAFAEPASDINITQENNKGITLKNRGEVSSDVEVYTNAMYFDYANPGDELLDDFPIDFGFRLTPTKSDNATFNLVYFFENNYNTLFNQTHALEMFLPTADGDYNIAAIILSPDGNGNRMHPELNVYGDIVHDPADLIKSVKVLADYNSNWLQVKVVTKNTDNALFGDNPIGVRYVQMDVSEVTAEFSGLQQVTTDKQRYQLAPRQSQKITADTSESEGFLFVKKNTIQNQIIDLN